MKIQHSSCEGGEQRCVLDDLHKYLVRNHSYGITSASTMSAQFGLVNTSNEFKVNIASWLASAYVKMNVLCLFMKATSRFIESHNCQLDWVSNERTINRYTPSQVDVYKWYTYKQKAVLHTASSSKHLQCHIWLNQTSLLHE